MPYESIELSMISLTAFISFFITLMVEKNSEKIFKGALLDQDFLKPQAFHKKPIARSGGLASILSLMIFFILSFFLLNIKYTDYFLIGFSFFVLGFLDDLKININPYTRLLLMIFILSFNIVFFSIQILSLDFIILEELLINDFFSYLFILLCFLFIINGANLIDGFNGLLTIHLIIINIILFLINLNTETIELVLILATQIIILICFLLFNFPKSKMFLGDSGSYLFGSLTVLNIIKTNNLNPEISSFFFCILLFYLFFEVFFSFFRKLYLKKSPLKPDDMHLHMLLYKALDSSKKFKDSNYLNSIVINSIFLFLIIPSIYFRENGLICRYWFFSLLIAYIIFYFQLNKNFQKN